MLLLLHSEGQRLLMEPSLRLMSSCTAQRQAVLWQQSLPLVMEQERP
jgi:hypothetical protein